MSFRIRGVIGGPRQKPIKNASMKRVAAPPKLEAENEMPIIIVFDPSNEENNGKIETFEQEVITIHTDLPEETIQVDPPSPELALEIVTETPKEEGLETPKLSRKSRRRQRKEQQN